MSKVAVNKYNAVFPMPVLMIAAYDEEGTVQIMNAAWGQICNPGQVMLFISAGHATTKAIRKTGAFSVALADQAHMKEADFVGIASGNTMKDKFARSGLHETKSDIVNAPVIEEFPLVMECELAEVIETETQFAIVGNIKGVKAEENVIGENGKVDSFKLNALCFDESEAAYYTIGEKAGYAWNAGQELMEK